MYNKELSESATLNLTGHYTKGRGFFEQLRFQDDVDFYFPGVPEFVGLTSDLVRRRWLDNDFLGGIANLELTPSSALAVTLGGAYNIYLGDHFGQVISIEDAALPSDIEYYRSDATKAEANGYIKADYKLSDKIELFGDVQLRNISYEAEGLDSDRTVIGRSAGGIDTSYVFFNPKAGITYNLVPGKSVFASYAAAQREPVRSDFLDAVGTRVPNVEKLHDFELGYRSSTSNLSYEANAYYQYYIDQLVVTGAVNDVGAAVRTNVDRSYRLGLELSAKWNVTEYFSWQPNMTISQNKISEFVEEISDFDNGGLQQNTFLNSDIAFSPSVIAGSIFTYHITPSFDASLLSKYVGRQFLDNTSNESRSISPYTVQDIQLRYKIETELIQEIEFKLLVNNVLNARYSSNGYSYSYIFGGLITENYLYPQAGTNFLLSASVMF